MIARKLSATALLLLVLPAAGLTSTASASVVLELSTHSSEDPLIPPSQLSASFEFSVFGNELTLSVTNQTTAPNEFNIRRVYFNADSSVTGLSLISSTKGGWSLTNNVAQAPGQMTMADGFGIYSFKLERSSGMDSNPQLIHPGQTASFTLGISGSGFSESSFTTSFSNDHDGTHMPGLIAAHFVQGDGDASAWGALIPAPSATLLLLGAFITPSRRRRPL